MLAKTDKKQASTTQSELSTSRSILIRGFGFITLFIIAMAAIGFFMVSGNQQQINLILEEQIEMSAIFTMRDAALKRTIILHHMTLLEDPFDKDDDYIKLKERAEDFLKARDIFIASEKHKAEAHKNDPMAMTIWNKVAVDINKATTAQRKITELVIEGDTKQASKILLNEAIPLQNRVLSQLTELLNIQRGKTEAEVNTIYQQNTTGLIFIALIAVWTIFWGIGIARSTIWRISKIEESLDKEKQKAQEADQQKSRFLANMSHEIRTPLTAIIGYSETLIEDKQNITDWKQYVSSIIRNGKHLHQLINDILDLSKIEANQLSTEVIPVSICELATEVEVLMGERARKKGLTFSLDYQFPIPKTIISDPTRLKQILINLCGNAIKFTAEGGITLAVQYDNTNNKLVFTIKDTGIGMTPEQVTELFKPYKQADTATTRKFGGTGLGLYISKQLIERLGGTLTLESKAGTGSTFIVTIDTSAQAQLEWVTSTEKVDAHSQQISTETSIPILRGKILLAEDNLDNQALISMHIKKTGAEVTIVENGQQAVDAALSEHFDLVLMDMQMPIMGGIEAIQTLRKKQFKTPIATLTANAMKEDIKESHRVGAEDFLTKPIDRKLFYGVLARHLSPGVDSQPSTSPYKSKYEFDDISDLVDMYINQLPETCYRIQRFVDAREWEGVKDEIHQLKGTGGAFGLPEITEQCIDIEKQILTREYESAQQLIIQLTEVCMNTVEQHTSENSST